MQPLSAAELTAALPRDGSLPGYTVTSTPESTNVSSTSDPNVKPEACRPLWDAHGGASAASVARAWVLMTSTGFAPPTESLTFASYDSGSADAHLASLDKALDACPSLSFLSQYGDRVTADIERVASQVTMGDASTSFRMHWTLDLNGLESDTFSLITTVRTGEATVTAVSDSIVGSQLSASQKRAFLPKMDHDMLKSQADDLRKAQVR
ncbi:hypothetical protein ACFVGN_15070 [Streptomyces sp. NPDC057757]|uniref:hypothetical protein n=1 Tax=Streptomyces sp. NPDC057757 TaxID=3346241 RepID=UPI00368F05F4